MGKSSAQQDTGTDKLAIVYPERQVEVSGRKITINPIPLKRLPRFMKTFARVASLAEGGAKMGDIIEEVGEEVLDLIDVCIDVDINDLTVNDGPELLNAFIDLNFTDEILGKWKSLVGRFLSFMPDTSELEQKG